MQTHVQTAVKNTAVLRIVFREDDHGETWCRFAILPREYVESRKDRLLRQYDWDGDESEMIVAADLGIFHPEAYRGPGAPFTERPYIYHVGKRWVVFAQSGGWDI